jgi:NDP-sugar pyrophosphorylase family protein
VSVCAVILAAGAGSRLMPLTRTLPKALCPVGNVALLDRALARLARHGLAGPASVAVNACHHADQIAAHVGNRAFVSHESEPLGTAGALARLREWIAGRAVLVGNADAYLAPHGGGPDLVAIFDGWNRQTVRLLCVPGGREFGGDRSFAGFSLLPADVIAGLPDRRAELVGEVWRPAERVGRLELVGYPGLYLDTGTPADYLAANLHAAGHGDLVAPGAQIMAQLTNAVIGSGARVLGPVTRSVVLPGGYVGPDETLVDSIRMGQDTTLTPHVPADWQVANAG